MLKSLLESGFEVTVLTRSQNWKLPDHTNMKAVIVDWTKPSSIVDAISNHSVVVSALPMDSAGTATQHTLIDACLTAGIRRFVPSAFGSDSFNDLVAELPVYEGKVQVIQRCRQLAQSKRLSYVEVACGPYLDWCIEVGLFIDAKKHSVTYYDGGDVRFSTTTLPTVGKSLVAILDHWEKISDRVVRVQDAVVTQKQLVCLAKEIQADGVEWTETYAETATLEKSSREKFARGEATAIEVYDLIKRAIWGEGFGSEMKELDNSKLGIPEMDQGKVRYVVSKYC